MIVVGRSVRPLRPLWYQRSVYNKLHELCMRNPGFHRLVIQIEPCQPMDTGHYIDPAIEPQVRRLLARVWRLRPAEHDDDPYVQL